MIPQTFHTRVPDNIRRAMLAAALGGASLAGGNTMATMYQSPQGYQQPIKRLIQSQTFVPNGTLTFQMPRNYDAQTIYIFVSGTVTYPGALVNAAVRGDAPYGILAKVELIVEGRQTLFSVPGYVLGMNNVRRHKRATYRERVETYNNHQQFPLAYVSPTSAMTISSTQPFAGFVCIDLQNIAGFRPKDTNLRTGGMQTFDLKLSLGDLTSMFYPLASAPTVTPFAAPNPGTALPTLTGYTAAFNPVVVALAETQEMASADGKISSPTVVYRWSNQSVNIAAANSNLEVLMPTDNFVTNVFLTTKIGGESVDNVLNNAILRRGVDVRYNLPISVIRALGQVDYDMSLFPGHYILDLVAAGNNNVMLSQAWNLQGGADTRVALDVGGASTTTTLDVTTVEVIPLRQG